MEPAGDPNATDCRTSSSCNPPTAHLSTYDGYSRKPGGGCGGPPAHHTYTPKWGFLPRGNDVLPPKLNCSISAARAACDALPTCMGFCFQSTPPANESAPLAKVYFKNASSCEFSDEWTSYLRDYVAPPPPPAESEFCPSFHPIRAVNVYDPSGPLLDDSGVWHVWEDAGGWSHWTSKDLVHWTGSFRFNTTHFGADTGSVSPTPSGTYAFWPVMPQTLQIASAVASDASLTSWTKRGATIDMPARVPRGSFRDPTRAFQFGDAGKWYVGVGCGNAKGAQFCLFESRDDQLASFIDRGSLFTTNITFGSVDKDVVWVPTNVSAHMMECPDLFPLGDKWVLLASLFKTNQWWVGTLAGDPPRFTPERVGVIDYGNGYAAKTGSTMIQSGATRRLVFGFTGWSEPTMEGGCGRSLVLPRELSVKGNVLAVSPIPEAAALRVPGSMRTAAFDSLGARDGGSGSGVAGGGGAGEGGGESGALAAGSRVEVRVECTGVGAAIAANASGKVGLRTLATADGAAFLEIGYDFAREAFYADHASCCATPNQIVQRAPLRAADLDDDTLTMHIFVDGGLVEAFAGGRVVITPLVAPDASVGGAAKRTTRTFSDVAQLKCVAHSWVLAY